MTKAWDRPQIDSVETNTVEKSLIVHQQNYIPEPRFKRLLSTRTAIGSKIIVAFTRLALREGELPTARRGSPSP